MQFHLDGEAQGTDTLDQPANGVSGDGSNDTSSETVHPTEGQTAGDTTEIFHEEGGRQFKTKEEFISFYRQQRGAASRVSTENKELRARLEKLESQMTQASAPTQQATPSQAQIEQVDEEVAKAADVLSKTGKFVSPAQLAEMQKQLAALQSYSEQMKLASATTAVNAFLSANQDAVGHEHELAQLITTYGLDKNGTEEGLRLAYRLQFGKEPNVSNTSQIARQAYAKGQEAAVKKSQAGGGAPGGGASKPKESGGFNIDFTLLDT